MRSLLIAAAVGVAAASGDVCTDAESCTRELLRSVRRFPTLVPVIQEFAKVLASTPREVLMVDSPNDSTWCPNSSYYEFFPAFSANVNVSVGTVTWPGDGCFTSMSATATLNGTTSVVVTLSGTGATSLLCSDYYVVATTYGLTLASVSALAPTSSAVSIPLASASQVADVHMNGVNINVLPCGLIGTINSALKTVSLFDAGSDAALSANNVDFLTERKVWPAATPYGQTIPAATIKNSIRSGDYLAITRLDGLDPMIMFGTGGVTGHSALAVWDERDGNLYVCESTDANPLGPVYFPPPYGIIRHEFSEWVTLAQGANYSVALLPLAKNWADGFNETAYWAWFETVQGMPYGYHSMLLSFLDTGGASFANLPLPVTNPTIPSLLNLLQLLLPNTSAGVSVYSMFTWGLNKRLNTSCTELTCIEDVIISNALQGKFPATLTDAIAMPEQDIWKYGTNYSMVCSEFAAHGWKTGFAQAFPVWNEIQAGEQTPKDNYQMALYDTTGRFNNANCPGGIFTDPTGNGGYCMLTGPYVLYLNGYNSVPIYAGMNNACPAQWPTYVRCPADNPTCC